MAFKDDLQQLYTQTRSEWRKWLEENHNIQKGVWFIFYKKRTDKTSVSYSDAVEEALCFGWIDSVSRKLDEEHHMLMFTPRKPKSPWSGINKERIKKIFDALAAINKRIIFPIHPRTLSKISNYGIQTKDYPTCLLYTSPSPRD